MNKLCQRTGCFKIAGFVPMLMVKPGYTAEPVELAMHIPLCKKHCEPDVNNYLGDAGWVHIVKGFISNGVVAPKRELTTVKFVTLDEYAEFTKNQPKDN